MPDSIDLIALSLAPHCGWRSAAVQLRGGVPPRDVLERIAPCPPGRAAELRAQAQQAIVRGAAQGLAPIPCSAPEYPAPLNAIADPPFVLWTRGDATALHGPAVAIVGSRAGSPYALAVAERLAGDLASRGLTIVSGLARGVDSAAHHGALASGGRTVAVLGSGVDVIYPPEHRALAGEIAASGAVVSELAPGTPPLKPFFPLRNRIISGLSRAVVVIEAGERSGSLITARTALEQGREVLAVPGNVLSGRNRGAHALLRDGARIVESADDVLDELGWAARNLRRGGRASKEEDDPVLAALNPGEICDLDLISERSGLPGPRLLPRLFELEMDGVVRRAGGGRFVRV